MYRTTTFARSIALGAVLFAAISCASTPRVDDTTSARPSRPARRSNAVITREELVASTARDAFQAVQMLRPDWLRGRGPTSIRGGVPEVQVYLDGQRMGGPTSLTQLSVLAIKELRFHSATEATQRWGTDHSGGAIEVRTR